MIRRIFRFMFSVLSEILNADWNILSCIAVFFSKRLFHRFITPPLFLQDFGIALLVLFRTSTGEKWNSIMREIMVSFCLFHTIFYLRSLCRVGLQTKGDGGIWRSLPLFLCIKYLCLEEQSLFVHFCFPGIFVGLDCFILCCICTSWWICHAKSIHRSAYMYLFLSLYESSNVSISDRHPPSLPIFFYASSNFSVICLCFSCFRYRALFGSFSSWSISVWFFYEPTRNCRKYWRELSFALFSHPVVVSIIFLSSIINQYSIYCSFLFRGPGNFGQLFDFDENRRKSSEIRWPLSVPIRSISFLIHFSFLLFLILLLFFFHCFDGSDCVSCKNHFLCFFVVVFFICRLLSGYIFQCVWVFCFLFFSLTYYAFSFTRMFS